MVHLVASARNCSKKQIQNKQQKKNIPWLRQQINQLACWTARTKPPRCTTNWVVCQTASCDLVYWGRRRIWREAPADKHGGEHMLGAIVEQMHSAERESSRTEAWIMEAATLWILHTEQPNMKVVELDMIVALGGGGKYGRAKKILGNTHPFVGISNENSTFLHHSVVKKQSNV